MNFKHKSFHSNPSQTNHLATLIIPLAFITGDKMFMPDQEVYFRDAKLHVGLTSGLQIEF